MDFERLQQEVFRRYGDGDLAGALDVVREHGEELAAHEVKLAFWRACLRSCLGDHPGALDELEQALAAGHWYGASSLADEDLVPVSSAPRFAAVAARCAALETRHRRELLDPLIVPAGGEEHGALVALHRAGGSPRRSLPHWQAAAAAGYRLVLPAAEWAIDHESRVWLLEDASALDLAAAARVAEQTAPALAGADATRTVLAGFSQGGAVAMLWALTGVVPAAALLVIGCSLRYQEALDATGDEAAAGLRAHFLVGDGERHVESTQALVERLRANGAEVTVDRRPGLGHMFPEDFSAEVGSLLSTLL